MYTVLVPVHKRRHFRIITLYALALLLAACLIGTWITGDATQGRSTGANITSMIDGHLLATAHRLAVLADTTEEQALARDAVHFADHELDLDFASAIRSAEVRNNNAANGQQNQLTARIARLKAAIASEQAQLAKLSEGDELDLAKAHLELDQDDLEDARQDLARAGGDRHAKLAQALQEHENADHDAQVPKVALAGPTPTLVEQVRLWLALQERKSQIDAAGRDAASTSQTLTLKHGSYEKQAERDAAQRSTATVGDLKKLSDQSKTLAEYDRRIQDLQQLAHTYETWSALVYARTRAALHLVLRSLSVIAFIVLGVALIDRAIRNAFRRQKDARRLHQMRVMATVGVQLTGLLLIVLVIFGPPNQITTLIGLVTAGLTVALKDFIVGFFGWFALMGKNGIRIGDWVEINGVGGEVIEIGILKTTLLEMGNWTSTGHPTGRRVSFVNSFALEGHYFNFSTAGQWLWDEVQVAVPMGQEPYRTAEQIRQKVEEMTAADAAAAEQDWERVTREYGTKSFSARPAVDVRPAVNGVNAVVRYITRGPQRYEVKSKIFEAIVALLHTHEKVPAE